MKYKKEPAFINRQSEMAYLRSWIEERPEHILFLYGPKYSGKTTLIQKFVEAELVDQERFMNQRNRLIGSLRHNVSSEIGGFYGSTQRNRKNR